MRTRLLLACAAAAVIVSTTAVAVGPTAQAADCEVNDETTSVRVEMNDRAYDVIVHVPDGATAGMPLVFNLHGSTQSGAGHRDDGAFDRAADRYGYIVAYPDGGVPDFAPRPPAPVALPAGYFWNIPGVPLVGDVPVPPNSRDDVQFIDRAIDSMAEQLCIDTGRVYVTGASGGGRMASLLGCVLSERIAAIAPVIGVRAGNPDPDDETRPDPATCQPSRPMPVAALHGMKDTTNPYEGGGSKYWRYSVPVAMERWAELNGCARRGKDQTVTSTVTLQHYVGCKAGTDVVLYVSTVLGHTWPGSTSTTTTAMSPITGDSDANFPGNDLILQFFDRHSL